MPLNNPPVPIGYRLLKQLAVTSAMTDWAVAILHDPQTYPMFATVTQSFGPLNLLARVEWHSPDFQNGAIHRGVTLYEPVVASADAASPAAGIDLSGFQPRVDWPSVVGSGICFAFIKATESTTLIDRQFEEHWANAKQAKLLRGAYHFFRPQRDARAQAEHFLSQLGDPGELPPVLDVEVLDGVAPADVVRGVSTWLERVAGSFGRPIIYTSPSFWNALPAAPEISANADLWVANWGARAPSPVRGWPSWTFWQYTNQANIAGIPGAGGVDENRYSGTRSELQAYSAAFVSGRGRPAPRAFNLRSTLGVQQALNFLHVAEPPLHEDGIAGAKTRAAIQRFQQQAGIAADGLVGVNTIAALQAALYIQQGDLARPATDR